MRYTVRVITSNKVRYHVEATECTVRVTTSETVRYHIEAESPDDAVELVMSGNFDPYETEDGSIDEVEVK